MKLKSLKFVLPILLVLPSLVFADWHYWRTPEGTEITSPITIHFDFSDWLNDVCDGSESRVSCNNSGVSWRIRLYTTDYQSFWGETHDRTITETTESFDLPVGTQIKGIAIIVIWNDGHWENTRVLEEADPYTFEIVETPTPSGTIGNTQNWLSQNEILAYIGKLTDDIPNYIALMIGLPIAFWFIEKTIAFVRGNFRPVEKIKEE
jgi:hypothetical protein